MAYCPNNCTFLPPRRTRTCLPETRKGGISRLLFLSCSVQIQNTAENPEALMQELCMYAQKGLLTMSSPIIGEKPKGSFTKKQLDSCTPEEVTGILRTIDFKDYVADNQEFEDYDFWNDLQKYSRLFQFGWITCEGCFHGFIPQWSVEVDQVVEPSFTESSYWGGTISWFGMDLIKPICIPNFVMKLEKCINEFDPEAIENIPLECLPFGAVISNVINSNPFYSNGSFTVAAYGGSGNYEYNLDGIGWGNNPNFTGLAPGLHTVQVREQNPTMDPNFIPCEVSVTVFIDNACDLLVVTTQSKDLTAPGSGDGYIKVTVSGGYGNYTYQLDANPPQSGNVFTGLNAGIYSITVVDLDTLCEVTRSVSLTEQDCTTLVVTFNSTDSQGMLNNGTIVAVVIDNEGPVRFRINAGAWTTNSSFTGLAPGIYTVQAKDMQTNCIVSDTITIADLCDGLTIISAVPTGSGSIPNGSILVTASGGSGIYSYSTNGSTWVGTNNLTGLSDGLYTVYVKDTQTGCIVTLQNIVVPNLCLDLTVAIPLILQNSTPNNPIGQFTIGVSGGSGNYVYSIDGGQNYTTLNTFSNLAIGTYTVIVKDVNTGCIVESNPAIISDLCPLLQVSSITIVDKSGLPGTGTITVNGVTGNIGVMNYRVIDTLSSYATAWQASNVFTNLPAGNFNVEIQDTTTQCTVVITDQIVVDVCTNLSLGLITTTGSGVAPTGQITVTSVTGGSGIYEYGLDGLTYQVSNQFINLGAGNYTVYVRDLNTACVKTSDVIVQNLCSTLLINTVSVLGSGLIPTGSVIITSVTGGTGNYEYSADGIVYQVSNSLTGLPSGPTTVYVRDTTTLCVASYPTTIPDICGNLVITTVDPEGAGVAPVGKATVVGVFGGTGNYEYSIDGSTYQLSNQLLNLPAGPVTVFVRDITTGCIATYNTVIPNICPLLTVSQYVTIGAGQLPTGEISVIGVVGGSGSYEYSLDGGTYQASPNFTGLLSGTYTVFTRDTVTLCVITQDITIDYLCPIFAVNDFIVKGAGPGGPAIGEITITEVINGTGNYEYSLDNITYQLSQTFINLNIGNYTVYVRDLLSQCVCTIDISVPDICPLLVVPQNGLIIEGSGVNNVGELAVTVVLGGSGSYRYSLDNISYQVSETFTGLQIGTHTVYVNDTVSNCITEVQFTVPDICPLLTVGTVATIGSGVANVGSLSVLSVTGGSNTYEYSIDGITFQASPTFTGLPVGTIVVYVRDLVSGCIAEKQVTISNVCPLLTMAIPAVTPESALNANDGIIVAGNVTGGTGTYEYSLDGSTYQISPSFTGLAAGTYTLFARDTVTLCVVARSNVVVG